MHQGRFPHLSLFQLSVQRAEEERSIAGKAWRRIELMRAAFQTLPVRALCSQRCDWMRMSASR